LENKTHTQIRKI